MKTTNKIILAALMASILIPFTACGNNSNDSSVLSVDDKTSTEASVNSSEAETSTITDSKTDSVIAESSFDAETSEITVSGTESAITPESTPSVIDPGEVPETSIDDFKIEIDKDEEHYTVVSYLGNDEIVKIPSEANGLPITVIIFDAFANNTSIKTVIIPDSVDFISNNVFSGCTSLEKVIILSNNVTFLDDTFSGCNATISYNGKDYTPDDYSKLSAN
jgi:uncharacterized lipoprotein YajG